MQTISAQPTTTTSPASVASRPYPSLDRIGGLSVLRVGGSFAQMGEQHGRLLAEEVRRGPIPYYRSMVERLLGKSFGPLSRPMAALLQRTIGSQVEKTMPAFAVETARGVARGAGLDEAEFLRGCTMPDSLLWLTARLNELRAPGPAVAHRAALGLGCTSAVAWGAATRDGRLYHARNLDYYGVENWVENAALIFHRPDQGMRYVSVSSAGVAMGGVTAMNEAGLTLTVHQHMFTDRTRLGGTPIGVIGDVVMREARSLDDAERILRSNRSIGCWTYMITDGKTKQVLCFEESPERQVALRSAPGDTTRAYANIYEDPALGATEVALYGSYWRHNMGRYARAKALLAEHGERAGALDARGMARIIGDAGSGACRVRDSIAMVMTVASVVFRPEDGVLWLGTGRAPTSRGEFLPFSLAREGRSPEHEGFSSFEPGEQGGEAAFEQYRRAYLAYIDRGDVSAADEHAAEAARLAPDQALFHGLNGLLALERGATERAEAALSRAIALGHVDEERVASFHLWRGRARDLAGQRELAQEDYRACLAKRGDVAVHAAARKNHRAPFNDSARRRMHVEMSLADVVMP